MDCKCLRLCNSQRPWPSEEPLFHAVRDTGQLSLMAFQMSHYSQWIPRNMHLPKYLEISGQKLGKAVHYNPIGEPSLTDHSKALKRLKGLYLIQNFPNLFEHGTLKTKQPWRLFPFICLLSVLQWTTITRKESNECLASETGKAATLTEQTTNAGSVRSWLPSSCSSRVQSATEITFSGLVYCLEQHFSKCVLQTISSQRC